MRPSARCTLVCLVFAAAALSACGGAQEPVALQITRLSPTPAEPSIAAGAPPTLVPAAGRAAAVPAMATPAPTTTIRGGSRGDGRIAPPPNVTPAPLLRPSQGREDPELLRVIEQALGADADGASVVVKRLTDGATARWNPDRVYYAASLYKLEVLYEAFRQRRLGVLSFDRKVAITDGYAAQDLGTLVRLSRTPEGDLEVREAVRGMVALSDNTSATILLDLLGHRNIDATMISLGLTASSVNTTELPTTASDMARLMEAVARGEGLDGQSAQEMVALLLAQETRAGIPRGLPAGVPVGNKTGTWDAATHDVAVVLAPTGVYVIAVLTDGSWAWDPVTRVSKAVFEYWSTPRQASGSR
jgi:beta-lactamase class A